MSAAAADPLRDRDHEEESGSHDDEVHDVVGAEDEASSGEDGDEGEELLHDVALFCPVVGVVPP